MNRPLEVITIGRSSLDLHGAQADGRWEDMGWFRQYIGGGPIDTLCGGAGACEPGALK